MTGCTLRFAQNSPLRTSLVDEATGNVKYTIDTPTKFARSVTRIRKFDPKKSRRDGEEEGDETETGVTSPESEEIARIYWKWFSPDRIIFRRRITNRSKLLPRAGKMKG